MQKLIPLFLILAGLGTLSAQTTINVSGSSVQPPFTFTDGSGLSQDLVNALNGAQNTYRFVMAAKPSVRANTDLENGITHVVLFSNIDWGMDKSKVDKTADLLRTGDYYIALKAPGRDQTWFAGVGTRPMIGVIGFNYAYAGFTKPDTSYVRHVLVSRQSPIKVAEVNALLKKLYDSGTLKTVFGRYGLSPLKL